MGINHKLWSKALPPCSAGRGQRAATAQWEGKHCCPSSLSTFLAWFWAPQNPSPRSHPASRTWDVGRGTSLPPLPLQQLEGGDAFLANGIWLPIGISLGIGGSTPRITCPETSNHLCLLIRNSPTRSPQHPWGSVEPSPWPHHLQGPLQG